MARTYPVSRCAILLLVVLSGCGVSPEPERPPNVVLIMIDDLGWTDLHVQGNDLLETPVIDRLAREGMRFTDAYAASPVCSPTRAAVITGLSPARVAITNHITGDQAQFQPPEATMRAAEMYNHLALEHVTIAEQLGESGYATAFLGKWHLSGTKDEMDSVEPSRRPEHQGFDLNVGGVSFGGPPSYFDPYRNPAIEDRLEGDYLTNRLADDTIEFMRENREGPFFVALWPYTVHWPMQAPADLIAKYANRPGFRDMGDGLESSTAYAAMIEAMDSAIGTVLAALDELDLAEETLVIFTSDNGAYGGVTDLSPLRAAKGHLYEGGIRVPLIVRWPGQVDPGTVSSKPVISMDFFPTILEAAGIKTGTGQVLDGVSLMPLLQGTGDLNRDAIFFHYPNYAFHQENRLGGAIRAGDYKLIEFYADGSVELYNVADDISESRDLALEMPDLARSMKASLDSWLAESGARMPTPIDDSSH
ncbi:MAG: arylsulfatase A [Rhodothermales bacterium]|jgi:arylsulfatase A